METVTVHSFRQSDRICRGQEDFVPARMFYVVSAAARYPLLPNVKTPISKRDLAKQKGYPTAPIYATVDKTADMYPM